MKKIYFLGLMGCFALANAQAPKVAGGFRSPLPVQKGTQDYTPASPVIARPAVQPRVVYGKTTQPPVKVGETQNDRQANASIYRRIITYPGNKITVGWMTSNDGPNTGYYGRGSGYNHFNGTTWGTISSTRIEPSRAGYPNYDYSAAMNKEVVFSHKIDTASKSGGLFFTNNMAIGSTTWTSSVVLDTPSVTTHGSVLWPRTAISGNYIHVIANYTSASAAQPDTVIMNNVRIPTVYSRYNTATSQWEVKNTCLPGYDGTRWHDGEPDGYSIDAQGSNVAVLMGGTGKDITLWKSNDNGSTWTQRIIDSFEVAAFYDQVLPDTPATCDGSVHVKLDGSGKAHCFWAEMFMRNPVEGDNTYNVFLGASNSVNYWYEGRPNDTLRHIGYAPDITGDGKVDPGTVDAGSRYGNSGVATMPYATFDNTGKIFVVYSALTEGDVLAGHTYRDVYCVYSADTGKTWSTPRNLTAWLGFNTEQMFASLPQSITDKLVFTYMESSEVGFYNSSASSGNPNKLGPFSIMYMEVPVVDIINNKTGINEVTNDVFTTEQNYPNPFNGITTIPVNLKKSADIQISVINILGQNVMSKHVSKAQPGLNNIEIESNNLGSGVYFYMVEAEGFKVTRRMVIE